MICDIICQVSCSFGMIGYGGCQDIVADTLSIDIQFMIAYGGHKECRLTGFCGQFKGFTEPRIRDIVGRSMTIVQFITAYPFSFPFLLVKETRGPSCGLTPGGNTVVFVFYPYLPV